MQTTFWTHVSRQLLQRQEQSSEDSSECREAGGRIVRVLAQAKASSRADQMHAFVMQT